MANMALQLLGFFFGLWGFAGTVLATLLPHWRITASVSSNMITATAVMRGLWMECMWSSTGIYQCELYRSQLALPPDLQAARALMVLSCFTSVLTSLVAVMGMKCTHYARGSVIKSALALSGGVGFLCAGLLCLITVSWTTNEVVMDFYDPFFPIGMSYEIGLAVYLGYASACLSLVGGLVLCWGSREDRGQNPVHLRMSPPSPPPVLNNTYASAPLDERPQAVKDNHAPSLFSLSSSDYRLNNYV
ncbi:claudin-14 [Austrofundulus limnaeus]|uniref:Claudin n=1 Tax=Austrofundulus limnaeus TaxID=52670 RepID=A0A2I4BGS6_AUSLI|nr:PREDICTED: claudin-14-like [Austrofundulus limnaeus]XP_013866949.1 PREDICTED: claudin-14-like [Austrofundulus limnaeus]XP_013866950.1 PREDICTED: claudin-14-like [Austrofundulus limnaeus]